MDSLKKFKWRKKANRIFKKFDEPDQDDHLKQLVTAAEAELKYLKALQQRMEEMHTADQDYYKKYEALFLKIVDSRPFPMPFTSPPSPTATKWMKEHPELCSLDKDSQKWNCKLQIRGEDHAPPSASSWNDFPVLAHYLGFPETGSKMLNDEFSQLFSDNREAFKQELTRRRDANQKEFDPFLAHAKADRDLSVTLNSKETQEKARSFSSHLNVLRSAYYLLHEKSFDSPEINRCRDFILNPAK